MKKVLHIINGLEQGGSETALFRLLKAMHRDYEFHVIVLNQAGYYSSKIAALGIPIYYLSIKKNPLAACFRLSIYIKQLKPDIVQTWLYHSDLLGGLFAKLHGIKKIIWGVRCEGVGLKKSTQWMKQACALLSNKIPQYIITNSKAASKNHIQAGYKDHKMQIIYNGFDANEFYPNKTSNRLIDNQLISNDSIVIGTLARFHQDKGYDTLIKAIDQICEAQPNSYFVLCGHGCHADNHLLTSLLETLVYRERVLLINGTTSPIDYLNTLDIFVQPSKTESFSNSLAEAMLCGLPCIATNVGETQTICNHHATLIPSNSTEQLALACIAMTRKSQQERIELGSRARNQIAQSYSMEQYTKQLQHLYDATNNQLE
ncbi:MAG: glycosyltransferase [Legionellaceae bacterium]|nr:glycosyltransferase [Legionellaceae bacterium]